MFVGVREFMVRSAYRTVKGEGIRVLRGECVLAE